MDKQVLDDYISSLRQDFEQYYLGYMMHPEEGRECKINDELQNIREDLLQIDEALIDAGDQVYKLMTNTILRLNNIHANIMVEKERYQDMQMLCNKYNDYDNVKLLDDTSFKTKNFVYEKESNLFMPMRSGANKKQLTILDITGNGYEGNKYVFKDYVYSSTVLDTSKRKNITDGSETNYYEYSRITISDEEEIDNIDFNKDNKEAQCTISFQAAEGINEIDIKTDAMNLEVTNVSYSLDGIEYTDMNIPYISINNKLDSYENTGYVYGSGQIAFPHKVQFFKVTFKSNGYANDFIAYQKVLLPEGQEYEENVIPKVDQFTTLVKSARRHVIKINEITAYSYTYPAKSQIKSVELINQDVNAISVFCNVYVPQGLGDDAVKFILTVNGIDHKVVPINSHKNGIKIVRFSTGNASSPYTERIGEKIKSAYLTIMFTNTSKIAPRVNNLKILIGGDL